MKKFKINLILLTAVMTAALSGTLSAEGFLDLETGAAFTGYNEVSIPADSGSRVSLKDDTESEATLALRVRCGYTFSGRHTVLGLMAPLTVSGQGRLDREITYQGKTFSEGEKVYSRYRFDSYRLTYRYSFIKTEEWHLAAGVTGKLRSADISLMSGSAYASRSNLGAVPLINFTAYWRFAESMSLLLDADALVTPFGRAEDALLALQYHPADKLSLRLGYRVLEGGSDGGGNVYTFALFHYVTAGITVGF